jgi:ribose 5-phosphate isomerase B
MVDAVREFLRSRDLPVLDVSEYDGGQPAWPAVGQKVGKAIGEGRAQTGVAFCWTGSGVAISASSIAGCRSTFCSSSAEAKDARQWHDANVLALSLTASVDNAIETVKAWLDTGPLEDPQHVEARRSLERLTSLAS